MEVQAHSHSFSEAIIESYTAVYDNMTDIEWDFLARKLNIVREDESERDDCEQCGDHHEDEFSGEDDDEEELTEDDIIEMLNEIQNTSEILYCTCEEAWDQELPSTECIGRDSSKCALNRDADFSWGVQTLKNIFGVRPGDAVLVERLVHGVISSVPVLQNVDMNHLLDASNIKQILFQMLFTISMTEGTEYWTDYIENEGVGFVYYLAEGYLNTLCSELSDMFADTGDENCHDLGY
jgi:hypothetical protein